MMPFVVDVFTASESIPRNLGSSIIKLSDGRLLLVAARYQGTRDSSPAHIEAVESNDGGHSWSEPYVLQENVGRKNVTTPSLMRLQAQTPEGRAVPIGLFYLVYNKSDDLKIFLRTSYDEGQSWSNPVCVTERSGYHAMANDRVMRLQSGRLLCPTAFSPSRTINHYSSLCFISDDKGKNWRAGQGEVDVGRRGAMEPEVIERSDGTVLMLVRTQYNVNYAAVSNDGGETWNDPAPFGPQVPEAPSTLRRIPSTGDWLLIFNDSKDPERGRKGPRTPLTVAVSSDEGKTWKHKCNLETRADRGYSYASLVFVDNRAIISHYVHDKEKREFSLRFRSVPVEWFYSIMPEHEIRIQAIACADDDGSRPASVNASLVQERVAFANAIYASAGVRFVFDPTTDFLEVKSTLLNSEFTVFKEPDLGENKWSQLPPLDEAAHDRARESLARLFRSKLVVIFFARVAFKDTTVDGNTYWEIKGRGGSSSSRAYHVNMPGSGGRMSLMAHEIGHYLQMSHPFVKGVETVTDAAEKIKKYVEVDGHSKDEGLDALDGDRALVQDTPPDAAGKIFKSEGLEKCGPVGDISIPVEFTDGTTREYNLAPDRSLIMSYFMGCSGEKTISREQGIRVRDGLEQGLRHELITLARDADHQIIRRAVGTAGAASQLEMVMVRSGRLATAVRDGSGNLKVIVWDIPRSGSVLFRRGTGHAGKTGHLAVCSMGLGIVATAVQTGSNKLKVIIWKVDDCGSVTRKDSATASGTIEYVAVCRIERSHLATAVRRSDENLEVSIWKITADGTIDQRATATAGKVSTLIAGYPNANIAMSSIMSNIKRSYFFATHIRTAAGRLKTIAWRYFDKKLERLDSALFDESQVGYVAGCAMNCDLSVAAVSDKDHKLRLVAWRFIESGELIHRGGTASAGTVKALSVCRMGMGLLATVVRTGGGKLKAILWDVSDGGDTIVRRGDVSAEGVTQVSACYAGLDMLAAAALDDDSRLKVLVWRIGTPDVDLWDCFAEE